MRLRDIENELKIINLNYENLIFEFEDLKNSFQELSIKLNNSIINKEEKEETVSDSSINEDTLDSNKQDQQNEPNLLGTLETKSSNCPSNSFILDLRTFCSVINFSHW